MRFKHDDEADAVRMMLANMKFSNVNIPGQGGEQFAGITRPEWLNSMRRPIRVVAHNEKQFDRFRISWRYKASEMKRARDIWQIEGVDTKWPLLVLPSWGDDSALLFLVRSWQQRGGKTIEIPELSVRGAPFTDEFSLVASTIIQIAKKRTPFRLTKAKDNG